MRNFCRLFVCGLSPLVFGFAFAGCASLEDELPESCVVIEEVKASPGKVVIDSTMEVRFYRIPEPFVDWKGRESETFGTKKSEVIARETDTDREWKEHIARGCEATWPVGSSCFYLKPLGKLRIRNTPENLSLIDKFMDEFYHEPARLEVQVRFVRVAQKTLDELGGELLSGKGNGCRYDLADFDAVPAGELERRLTSRRDLLGNEAPRILALSGYEVACASVTECRYPQDFDVAMGEMVGGRSNETIRIKQTGFATAEPQNFEMREVGTKLQVTPTLSDDGHAVSIRLNTQVVASPEWMEFGTELPSPNGGTYALPMKQPFFPVRSVDVTLNAVLGETLLVSAHVATGKTDETELVFLCVRRLDASGRVMKSEHGGKKK